ncbi:MAG TPA: hypothetical protein VJ571_01685 [Candidatus Nitrosotalea sp.]|nr:hypothetical protein [Candidatus Nitrosotalea sp.]
MGIRFITVSKIIFDQRWNELGPSDVGAREQGVIHNMIIMRAKSPKAILKIKIIDDEYPIELSFTDRSQIRVGSGMISYESLDLEKDGFKKLALGALDDEMWQ